MPPLLSWETGGLVDVSDPVYHVFFDEDNVGDARGEMEVSPDAVEDLDVVDFGRCRKVNCVCSVIVDKGKVKSISEIPKTKGFEADLEVDSRQSRLCGSIEGDGDGVFLN